MITGQIKNLIDQIWETFWTGGITNTITLLEKFEGFGVNLKLNCQNRISIDAASKAMDSIDIMSVEELDQMHREGANNE